MDGAFVVLCITLGVPIILGIAAGAAFRGRFGRGLGLVAFSLGLAGLAYNALSYVQFRHDGLFAWVILLLMAGGVTCFGGACWLAARGERDQREAWPSEEG